MMNVRRRLELLLTYIAHDLFNDLAESAVNQ